MNSGEPPPPRLVLFPGLGADERMFQPQRRIPAEIEVPRWIAPEPREPLSRYARRLAETIRTPPPFYLGGVSIGGMIALEVARHLGPLAVFLIASCRSCRSISPLLRLGRHLSPLVPAGIQKTVMVRLPSFLRASGACTTDDQQLVVDMLRDTPPHFLKWGHEALLAWQGPGPLPMSVYHVHGDCDHLIRCPPTGVDRVIPGGGHLINFTHADEVNEFLRLLMQGGQSHGAIEPLAHADSPANRPG
jgi:pimeloyl-ACP methyl ester carboxylesterase